MSNVAYFSSDFRPVVSSKRDNKSHKKATKDKIQDRKQETANQIAQLPKSIKKKIASPAVVQVSAPASPIKNATSNRPNKMRKPNSKENLLDHLEDHLGAYYDAHEEKGAEFYDIQEDLFYAEMSETRWLQDYGFGAFNAFDYSYEATPQFMTISEYEAFLLQEKKCWILWKSHGLSRKQFEDNREYEKNRKALCDYRMNSVKVDPEYEMDLLQKIQAFEDKIDAWAREEEAKMAEWFANFEENNPDFMERIQRTNANHLDLFVEV
jgi:hypothetical protein